MFDSMGWRLFLALRNVLGWTSRKVVFKEELPKFQDVICAYLDIEIEIVRSMREKKMSIRPKHVWAVHYPWHMMNMGPLSLVDTNVGEQRNCKLKSFSQSANQSKNVLHTISMKDKQVASLNQATKTEEVERLGVVNIDQLDKEVQDQAIFILGDPSKYVFYKQLKIWGTVFRADGATCVCYGNPIVPSIGLILMVAEHVVTKSISLLLQKTSIERDEVLDLLVVTKIPETFQILPKELVSEKTLVLYNICNFENKEILLCSFPERMC